MPVVASPIITSVITSAVLRPTRSPRCPNTMPPSGRAAKPAQNVTNASSVATPGSIVLEKNTLPNTSAAAVP